MKPPTIPSILRHPLLLYVATALVAFHKVLFGGQAYYANDLLGQFGPWRAFLRDALLAGEFPLWNPFMLGGQPCFADLQMMLLYPLHWFTLFFHPALGLSLFFFLHMVLAGWGMHRWMRALKASDTACLLSGLLYCLSAFFWWEIIHPPVLAAFAWLPWVFGSLESLSQEATPRRAFGAGAVFAQLFLAGSFQVTLGAFYGGLAYFLFRLVSRLSPLATTGWGTILKPRWKAALLAGLVFVSGAFPLFLQAIPTAEFSRLSVRRTPDLNYDNFNSNYSMQPWNTAQFLFPTYSVPKGQTIEIAIQTPTSDRGDVDFLGNFGYLGIWSPLLAFLAFRRRDRLAWLLGALALLTLMTAYGRYFFVHRIVCAVLPGFNLIQVAFRFIYLYVLAVAVLAGLGYQWLERRLETQPTGFAANVLPWVWAGLLLMAALPRPDATGREILGLLLGAAGFGLLKNPATRRSGRILFLVAAILPCLLMGWGAFGTGSKRNMDFEKRAPEGLLDAAREAAPFRIFVGDDVPYPIEVKGELYRMGFPLNLCSPLRYKTFRGYNPLRLKSFSDVLTLPFPTVLYLTATRSILASRDMGDPQGFKRGRVGDLWLYELDPPPAYLSAPTDLRVVRDPEARLAALRDPSFKPYMTAILNEPLPALWDAQLSGKNAVVDYRVLLDSPDRQIWSVRLSETSLVVFADVNFPGWKARVDGRETPLVTANHAFRALLVPSGEHEVVLTFEPWWWPATGLAALLWYLSATLVWAIARIRREPEIPTAE